MTTKLRLVHECDLCCDQILEQRDECPGVPLVHLLDTDGSSLCGAEHMGGASPLTDPDINRITCLACAKEHADICGYAENPPDDWEECGSCSGYHRPGYPGDCRNDAERWPSDVTTAKGWRP